MKPFACNQQQAGIHEINPLGCFTMIEIDQEAKESFQCAGTGDLGPTVQTSKVCLLPLSTRGRWNALGLLQDLHDSMRSMLPETVFSIALWNTINMGISRKKSFPICERSTALKSGCADAQGRAVRGLNCGKISHRISDRMPDRLSA